MEDSLYAYHIFTLWESLSFKYTCSFCDQLLVANAIVLGITNQEGSHARINHWGCAKHYLDCSFIVQRDNSLVDINIQDRVTRASITNEVNTAIANPRKTTPLIQEEPEELGQQEWTIHDQYLKWFSQHFTEYHFGNSAGNSGSSFNLGDSRHQ